MNGSHRHPPQGFTVMSDALEIKGDAGEGVNRSHRHPQEIVVRSEFSQTTKGHPKGVRFAAGFQKGDPKGMR